MPLADSKHLDSLHAGHARLDASDISSQRQIARSYLAALDKALQDIWALGRNVIIGWTAETNGIEVLTAPNVRLPDVAERIPDLVARPAPVQHGADAAGQGHAWPATKTA